MRLSSIFAAGAVVTWAFFTHATAYAASTNCGASATLREKLICSDQEMKAADRELRATYIGFTKLLSPAGAMLVEADQQGWLRWVDRVCPAASGTIFASPQPCFRARYEQRQNAFAHGLYRSSAGQVIFMRSRFVPPRAGPVVASPGSGTGFGWAEYEWPQIDDADANAQAWNKAVLAAAARAVGGAHATTLETAYNAPGDTITLDYNIDAADQAFIGVSFTRLASGDGITRPQPGYSSFLYWLLRQRECKPEDIFQAGAAWKARVEGLSATKLKAMDEENAIFHGAALSKGLERSTHANHWSLSRRALKVTFDVDEVAPYSTGMPSVNLLWSELMPLLNHEFHPEALPQPVSPADEEIEY